MAEEIRCPECRSINIEEMPYESAAGPRGPRGKFPEEAEYPKYNCLDCGLVFFKSNLRE